MTRRQPRRLPRRYRIRSILVAVALISVCLTVLRPYLRRQEKIAQLAQRDVYIATVSVSPAWLAFCPILADVIVTPVQAQVLIQPATHGRVRALGMEMRPDEAIETLKELQRQLQEETGLRSFILIYDWRPPEIDAADSPHRKDVRIITDNDHKEFQKLIPRLCRELQTLATPCGLGNFPNVVRIVKSGQAESAEGPHVD